MNEVKTILFNLFIFAGVVVLAVVSFQLAPAQAQSGKILPTSALVAALATPTVVQPTATATASPTKTLPPSSTPTASPAPSATRDLGALATEQAILQHARDVQLSQDVTAQEIAWGWVKLAGVALLMVLAVVAILTAYVRSLRGDFKKPNQQPPQAPEKAQDAPSSDEGMIEAPERWLDLIDWETGKMPYATKAVESMFGGQNQYREFLGQMKLAGWAERKSTGWYITADFAKEVGRNISPIR